MEFAIAWLVIALVTALGAQTRGRDFSTWFLIGVVTGIFGMAALVILERKKLKG